MLLYTYAFSQTPLTIDNQSDTYKVINPVYFFEDKTQNLAFDQVLKLDSTEKFESFKEKDLSFGFTESTYWLKLQVVLSEQAIQDWSLIISNPYLPELELYYKDEHNLWKHVKMGALYPFSQRLVAHRFFVIPLLLKSNQVNTFYLKVNSKGDALNVPIEVQRSTDFYAQSIQLEIGYGIFFGILFFVLVNNAFLYISLGERSYLLYVAYILFIGLTNSYISGHIFEYLFIYLPFSSIHYYTLPYFIFFTHIFGTLFSLEFLRIYDYIKGLYRFILLVLLLNVVAFTSFFITQQTTILIIAHLLGVVLLMSAFISGFLVWRKGNIAARYYVVAYVLLFSGSILFILRNSGLMPDFYVTVHGLELGILAEAIMLSVALADKNGIQKRNAKEDLERKVYERTLEIGAANIEIAKNRDFIEAKNYALEKAFKAIEEQNKDITASITYAQRIQGAVLPNPETLKQIFPESFILYKPRDIVSGDFYWFEKINPADSNEDYFILAVADCTGHGVPGAFMSMIGNSLLNEIVLEKNIFMPHLILDALHAEIQKALKQKESNNQDGMDISLCLFDLKNKKLHFSGAKSTLYHIQNGELVQIKGDRFSIGGYRKQDDFFTLHQIDISNATAIYLCSDGYQDQFGGEAGKKFSTQKLRDLFQKISSYNASEQERIMEETLVDWMSQNKQMQIDDILVMGIKVV